MSFVDERLTCKLGVRVWVVRVNSLTRVEIKAALVDVSGIVEIFVLSTKSVVFLFQHFNFFINM